MGSSARPKAQSAKARKLRNNNAQQDAQTILASRLAAIHRVETVRVTIEDA
jgi:hypothetical protein